MIDSEKTYLFLIIKIATAAIANRLLNEGIIKKNNLKNCEFFDKACRITRYYNY